MNLVWLQNCGTAVLQRKGHDALAEHAN